MTTRVRMVTRFIALPAALVAVIPAYSKAQNIFIPHRHPAVTSALASIKADKML